MKSANTPQPLPLSDTSPLTVQLIHRFLYIFRTLSYTSWNPVLLSCQIDDHPFDPFGYVGFKFSILAAVIFFHCFHHYNDAFIDHILHLGKSDIHVPHLQCDALDQSDIPKHDLLFHSQIFRLFRQILRVLQLFFFPILHVSPYLTTPYLTTPHLFSTL